MYYLLLYWRIAEEFLIKGLEQFTHRDMHGFVAFIIWISAFPSWHTYKSKYKLNSTLITLVVLYYILDSFHCFLPHTYLPQFTIDFTLVFAVGAKQV